MISNHGCITKTDANVHLGVGVRIMQIVDQALYLCGETGLEVEDFTAPHLILSKDCKIIARDNTEVVTSTLQSSP